MSIQGKDVQLRDLDFAGKRGQNIAAAVNPGDVPRFDQIPPPGGGSAVLKFSGGLLATGGPSPSGWPVADRGNGYNNDGSNLNNAMRYPMPPGTARRLRVRVNFNSFVDAATATIRKNNTDTAIAVVIPAGGTGLFEDLVNTDLFADGDGLDLFVVVASGGGVMFMSGTIEFGP
jgi:hypothetical protein